MKKKESEHFEKLFNMIYQTPIENINPHLLAEGKSYRIKKGKVIFFENA